MSRRDENALSFVDFWRRVYRVVALLSTAENTIIIIVFVRIAIPISYAYVRTL